MLLRSCFVVRKWVLTVQKGKNMLYCQSRGRWVYGKHGEEETAYEK